MPSDIVFPRNNEKEIIAMAERMGYDTLFFAYDRKTDIAKFQETTKIRIISAATQGTASPVILRANESIRHILETLKPAYLYGMEFHEKRDSMHQRNAGLNQVLCSIAEKNKVTMTIPLQELLRCTAAKRSIIIGRISQNCRLCRKYKVKMKLATFASSPYQMRSPRDLMSLALIFGMDTKQAKEAVG